MPTNFEIAEADRRRLKEIQMLNENVPEAMQQIGMNVCMDLKLAMGECTAENVATLIKSLLEQVAQKPATPPHPLIEVVQSQAATINKLLTMTETQLQDYRERI